LRLFFFLSFSFMICSGFTIKVSSLNTGLPSS
jgi:hypothetical protein